MVTENLAALLDVLDAERLCCSRLVEVSRTEQESLAKNDADVLSGQINEMQAAVRELHGHQAQRNSLLESMAKELGLDADRLSLYDLADRLEGPPAENLRERFRELVRVGETLFRVNQQTIYLINFSLDLVERQIGVWTGALTEGDGYGRDGRTAPDPSETRIVEEKV
jgi:hypothetical protein